MRNNALNLGPKSQALLLRLNIRTLAQLRKAGAIATYSRARRIDATVSLNFLYGLVAAIDECHWRDVQKNRKLELLTALERVERDRHPKPLQLRDLRNIGPAMLKDFAMLKIQTVEELARRDADTLYEQIQTLTGTRHDPCVWDTYAAAIHQAKTGEALPWWDFTKLRKARAPLHKSRRPDSRAATKSQST